MNRRLRGETVGGIIGGEYSQDWRDRGGNLPPSCGEPSLSTLSLLLLFLWRAPVTGRHASLHPCIANPSKPVAGLSIIRGEIMEETKPTAEERSLASLLDTKHIHVAGPGERIDVCRTCGHDIRDLERHFILNETRADAIANAIAAARIAAPMLLGEDERQMVLLGLGWIAFERPGFAYYTGKIADKLNGREMFEQFKELRGSEKKG